MKLLHIAVVDLNDGAARGVYWLHLGLKELGIENKVLTNLKTNLGYDHKRKNNYENRYGITI